MLGRWLSMFLPRWGEPGTLPPNFQSAGTVSYTPPQQPQQQPPPPEPQAPPTEAPADAGAQPGAGLMRPKNNAMGDFWGPVVQRMIQQYLQKQRGGGMSSGKMGGGGMGGAGGGMSGGKMGGGGIGSGGNMGGYGGRGGEPASMG